MIGVSSAGCRRAAAVRELLRRGLSAEGFLTARAGEKSQNFGVVGANNPQTPGDGAAQ